MEEHDMSTLREKHNKKGGFSSCFSLTCHRRGVSIDSFSSPWSPRTWIKSKTSDTLHDHDKATPTKSRNFISRMAHRRRHASADFSYDPLSYSLNFEETPSDEDDNHHNNFMARLPASPPKHIDRPPRIVPVVARSETGVDGTPRSVPAGGNQELLRGFEALSTRMEKMKTKEELSSTRAAAVAEVRRSLELDEVPSSPLSIPTNRKILVDVK